jgi:hypothetical protein
MSSTRVDFKMDAGEDWQRKLILSMSGRVVTPNRVYMEVRNSSRVLCSSLNSDDGQHIFFLGDGSILLHLSSAETRPYGVGFPGVIQAVSFWGTGRAYNYDLFVSWSPGVWAKLIEGFITVRPSVTRSFPQ